VPAESFTAVNSNLTRKYYAACTAMFLQSASCSNVCEDFAGTANFNDCCKIVFRCRQAARLNVDTVELLLLLLLLLPAVLRA
jgi:hypothetical protein